MRLELADFAGRWRIRRRIDDHLAGQVARFEGLAEMQPAATMPWLWVETGELRLGDAAPMSAERRYLWAEEGGRIRVRFPDGRAFHDFSATSLEAAHWCEPDDYRVRYDFGAWPAWQAQWRVRGPRKDYTLLSEYERVAP